MVDTVTSLALQSRGIVPPTGASVNASCEFVRPGGIVGDDIVGEGEVVQLGEYYTWRVEWEGARVERKAAVTGQWTIVGNVCAVVGGGMRRWHEATT
jgi:acyl-coenzyme A thioesterase PaaI-like protein